MYPRVIWSLWLQGWENAPDLVHACGASWWHHNRDWNIHYVTRDSLGEFIELGSLDRILEKNLPGDALSDVIRLALLRRYGGVWVDSTAYCLRPLDEWLHQATPTGFFAFNRPGPDRMLSSWFLVADQELYIIDQWLKSVETYWQNRSERDNYFWLHQLFEKIYNADLKFRMIWDATPKLTADGPHCFIPYDQLLGPVSHSRRLVVETAQTPMLKLTHKIAHSSGIAGTTYRWLCERIPRLPTQMNSVTFAKDQN